MRPRLTRDLPALVAILALVALYGRLLLPGTAFVERDISGLHLPMLTALARVAREGIPYWNPLVHGGQPLLTNPHYAVFYPPTWPIGIVPPHAWIGWLVFLHAALGGLGAWRFLRHLGGDRAAAGLAAIGLFGGGAFCSNASMLNLFMGAAWLPWILLWGDRALRQPQARSRRRNAAKLAVALAAQILSGSPVTPLLSVLALLCLATERIPGGRRRRLVLISPVFVGLGLAAAQIVPTLRHLTDSSRTAGVGAEMATTWSTPPIRLLELFLPRLFGDLSRGEFFLYFGYPGSHEGIPLILSLYCGALVVALAISGLASRDLPRRRALGLMAAVGLFLALGRYNPFYTRILLEIPPFSIIRFPEKFLLLSTTALPLLAALGWQRLLSSAPAETGRSLRPAIVVSTAALLVAVLLYLTPIVAPHLAMELIEGVTPEVVDWKDRPDGIYELPEEIVLVRAGLLGRELFLSAVLWGVALVVLWLHRRQRLPRRVLVSVTLLALAVDLTYYGWRQNRPVPAAVVLEPPAGLETLPPATGRVFSDAILFGSKVLHLPDPGATIPSDLVRSLQRLDPYTANLWGYGYALHGDPDLMLTATADRALETFLEESRLRREGWSERAYRLLGAWNVGILARRRSPEAQLEERRATGGAPVPARLVPNPEVLPRFRLVSSLFETPDRAGALRAIRNVEYRLAERDAVVRNSEGDTLTERRFDPDATIRSVREGSQHIVIDYEASGAAYLIAAVTSDRDWRATVDGERVPIDTTVLGQMGIELESGPHRLELVYRNPAVLWGAMTSLLFLLGTAIVLAFPGGSR